MSANSARITSVTQTQPLFQRLGRMRYTDYNSSLKCQKMFLRYTFQIPEPGFRQPDSVLPRPPQFPNPPRPCVCNHPSSLTAPQSFDVLTQPPGVSHLIRSTLGCTYSSYKSWLRFHLCSELFPASLILPTPTPFSLKAELLVVWTVYSNYYFLCFPNKLVSTFFESMNYILYSFQTLNK